MSLKIDLHTHSWQSPDGGLKLNYYEKLLETRVLDYIAVTDHDTIEGAREIKKHLGDRIIIGQEITTSDGEIIGLYLKTAVVPGMTALNTAAEIKNQGGLVYIPHPFETVRKGLNQATLDKIAPLVDIVETYNARAVFQNKGPAAITWARMNSKAGCASSDAHGPKGIGGCFTEIGSKPDAASLPELLAKGLPQTNRPPLISLLYPKYNRLHGKITKNRKIKNK